VKKIMVMTSQHAFNLHEKFYLNYLTRFRGPSYFNEKKLEKIIGRRAAPLYYGNGKLIRNFYTTLMVLCLALTKVTFMAKEILGLKCYEGSRNAAFLFLPYVLFVI